MNQGRRDARSAPSRMTSADACAAARVVVAMVVLTACDDGGPQRAGARPAVLPAVAAPVPQPIDDLCVTPKIGDLTAWDAATAEQKLRVGDAICKSNAALSGPRLEIFASGGQTHEMLILRFAKLRLEFVLIPTTKSSADEGDATSRLSVEHPFLIARTETTWGMWHDVRPADRREPRTDEKVLPQESVSGDEALSFCKSLSLDLPTEDEWEWACRGGQPTADYCCGDDLSELATHAWYSGTAGSGDQLQPVGRTRSNAFGLFDMHGNVAEWCLTDQKSIDAETGIEHPVFAIRGGSAYDAPANLRSSSRQVRTAAWREHMRGVGFRPVLRIVD